MKLKSLYQPIEQDIANMELELKKLFKSRDVTCLEEVFGHYFSQSGKYLRPALVFLSAGAVREERDEELNKKVVKLAMALELLHNASLVHDDIIDEDSMRRGQRTLNSLYGNKIAVLAGDILHTYAYSIVTELFDKEYADELVELCIRMCVAEIEQAQGINSFEGYLRIIEGKTALFTSICCKLGATMVQAKEEEIDALATFGLCFGMTYQLIDDHMDSDLEGVQIEALDEANKYIKKAKCALEVLEDTAYKEKLIGLIEFIADFKVINKSWRY